MVENVNHGQRLKMARELQLLSKRDVAKRSGVAVGTITRAEQSEDFRDLHPSNVAAILEALGLTAKIFMAEAAAEAMGIPLFDRIPASPPTFVGAAAQRAENAISRKVVQTVGVQHPMAYAVTVHGESMSPTYRHGDIVVAQPLDEKGVINGHVYILWLHDDDGTMKRVFMKTPEHWLLVPDNPQFAIAGVEPSKITKMDRVVALIRPDPAPPVDVLLRAERSRK